MGRLDTSRAPSGERTIRAIVDAVLEHGDQLEDHYLEIKSELDLTAKKDQAKLAKFFLGASNRMPDVAAKHFRGYAVMVIGASKGSLTGVPPVEQMDIEKAVKPFLGADGPHWDIERVAVPDSVNQVLLLIVDPPQRGQPPFICLKNGGSGEKKDLLRDGATYFRARGETREANSAEMAQLLRRGATSTSPEVDVDVNIIGEVTYVDRTALMAVCDEYLNFYGNDLRLALTLTKSADPVAGSDPFGLQAAMFSSLFTQPEERSEDEYHAEIERWERKTREAWPLAIDRFIAGMLDPAHLEVVNKAETYLERVAVKVHVDGDVSGIEAEPLDEDADAHDLGLPHPPRAWGPTTFDPAQILAGGSPNFGTWVPGSEMDLGSPRTTWRNSGSMDLTFNLDELHPTDTDGESLGTCLITSTPEADGFSGTWRLTARGHDTVYTGRTRVKSPGDKYLVFAFRIFLGLAEPTAEESDEAA